VEVATAAQLHSALDNAEPGDVVVLADGVYQGKFVADQPGTQAAPITLCGSRNAILNAEGPSGGYVLHLNNADHWRITGITVRHGQKGIMLDETDHAVIDRVEVHDIGDEGIHLRKFSSHNVVRDSVVHDTGNRNTKFGEGIYIGSARSNWSSISGDQPDASNDNLIEGNTIYNVTGEPVDIKEGTERGVLRGNSFDGSSIVSSGADSWVDVKGRDWLIEGNVGVNSPMDGFQTHEIVDGWGTRNVFRDNVADVNGPGFGFSLTPIRANVVECSNDVSDGAEGYANVACEGGEGGDVAPVPAPDPTPSVPASECPAATISVSTSSDLEDALDDAGPGDVIVLAPHRYAGEFETRGSGTETEPIWLCGQGAVLVGEGIDGGEVLSFNRASHWRVQQLTLTEGQTGLEIKASEDIHVARIFVTDIGDEGVVVKYGSSRSTLVDVSIDTVGLRRDRNGYGFIVTDSDATRIENATILAAPAGDYRIDASATGTVVG
jgi:nitrous oxidase accessory protein NosD